MSQPLATLGTEIETLLKGASVSSTFISQLANGVVDVQGFNNWLYQDYVFVRAFIPFVLAIEARISNLPEHRALKQGIIESFDVIKAELALFEKRARANSVKLPEIPPVEATIAEELSKNGGMKLLERLKEDYAETYSSILPFNLAYLEYELGLTASHETTWQYLVVTLWAVEFCYREAYRSVASSPAFSKIAEPALQEFVAWWGLNAEFDAYVSLLGTSAKAAMEDMPLETAREAVTNICQYEVQFFDGSLKR